MVSGKGTYLLMLHLREPRQQLGIGKLGCFDFAAGFYLYVGSAFGAGGLAARLTYHQRPVKQRPHWHIDYLRPHAHLCEVWSIACAERLEDRWCTALMGCQELTITVPGFGASDTSAPSHLFYAPVRPSARFLSRVLLPVSAIDNPGQSGMVVAVDRFGD